MQYLDHVKLQTVMDGFTKAAFVPMPGGQAEPVAGAGPMTAGMTAPMGGDPAAMGGMPPVDPATGMPIDPNTGMPIDPNTGMPMDPAAMGGMPPMDPAAMGGMPPMDPAAMGGMPPMDPAMMGGMPPPAGNITMSVPELLQLIEVIKGGGGGAAPADPLSGEGAPEDPSAKPKKTSGTAAINEKLDALLGALGMAGGGAMPPQGM